MLLFRTQNLHFFWPSFFLKKKMPNCFWQMPALWVSLNSGLTCHYAVHKVCKQLVSNLLAHCLTGNKAILSIFPFADRLIGLRIHHGVKVLGRNATAWQVQPQFDMFELWNFWSCQRENHFMFTTSTRLYDKLNKLLGTKSNSLSRITICMKNVLQLLEKFWLAKIPTLFMMQDGVTEAHCFTLLGGKGGG